MTIDAEHIQATSTPRPKSHWRPKTRLLVVLLALGLLAAVGIGLQRPNPAKLIVCAEGLLSRGKPTEALQVLQPLLALHPPDGTACLLAARAAARRNQFDAAVGWYERVPVDHERRGDACLRAGDLLLEHQHQLSRAALLLEEALKRHPDSSMAQGHLAGIYGLCGMTQSSKTLRLKRLRGREFVEIDLLLLGLGDTAAENAGALGAYVSADPEDPLTLIARGNQSWQKHDLVEARSFYEQGLTKRPDLADAQARYGRILCELADEAAFLQWHSVAGLSLDEHPEIWAVRGDWSLRASDIAGAIRCYWEAAKRDPTHRRAHYQLGQTLSSLGETQKAEPFQRRHACLQELLLAAKFCGLEVSGEGALRAAAAASACSQPWEAWGWTEVARRRGAGTMAAVPRRPRPPEETPQVLLEAQPARQIDLASYPLPRWMGQKSSRSTSTSPIAQNNAAIHFVDDAARLGMDFQYVNGDTTPGPGMRMFQFSGGGTGVLDYDRDGWPDVWLTQGGDWPLPEANPPHDALFRNRAGEAFLNVAELAGIVEGDYSQGLAIADFDNDGWPDVFVANVAGNRMFRNNGDGTFVDVTQTAGVTDTAWSTSVAFVDLNGDALPDLYVVNYLTGSDLLDRVCRQSNGMVRACTPHEFEAAQDQLLLNLGDGHFRDVTAESGIVAHGGKGLGVVAADFDATGRISLFVGNDTTANFFFHNATARKGEPPRFEEEAIVTGLAFDREGRSQACMGIAADDANGDGELDLFVTNYYHEANTLYQRQPTLMFLDVTAEVGLREPSLNQLGFGTQFLDADLDGWPDLVVTNGHVDDETARGIPLHMPTQVYHNLGQGRFVQVPAETLGPWFEGKYLGRGLARIDWNRDGLEDFVVSNLDSPAALLTNTSSRRGRYVALQLSGRTSARDSIGATITVKSADRTLTKQLTAGDGYQASNEHHLIFGVGQNEQVEVLIRWPSGLQQSFSDVDTECTWLAIEARPQLVRLR